MNCGKLHVTLICSCDSLAAMLELAAISLFFLVSPSILDIFLGRISHSNRLSFVRL
jgi:hypothetical protein